MIFSRHASPRHTSATSTHHFTYASFRQKSVNSSRNTFNCKIRKASFRHTSVTPTCQFDTRAPFLSAQKWVTSSMCQFFGEVTLLWQSDLLAKWGIFELKRSALVAKRSVEVTLLWRSDAYPILQGRVFGLFVIKRLILHLNTIFMRNPFRAISGQNS